LGDGGIDGVDLAARGRIDPLKMDVEAVDFDAAIGTYDALATTLDATRKCGPGVVTGIPIGQSAGNDGIVRPTFPNVPFI